jgi:3-dehydroquinate dehydratase type I
MKNNIVGVLTSKNIEQQLYLLKKNKNFISFLEIRIDSFYKNKTIEKIPYVLKKIKDLLPEVKTILTFRKFEEGGCIKISENTRFDVISKILEKYYQYIDFVDIEFFSEIKNKVIQLVKKYKKTIILSYHRFNLNTDIKNIKKIIGDIKKIQKFVTIKKCRYIIKIVFQCNQFRDYLKILKNVYNMPNKTNFKKITIFTIGKTSLLTRVVCLILNMPLVYGATISSVIPTQPTIIELIRIKKLIGIIEK